MAAAMRFRIQSSHSRAQRVKPVVARHPFPFSIDHHAMATEYPFELHVSDEDLQRLHQKLELTTFPDELDEAGWDYGAPLADVGRLVARWKDGFDWRKAEAAINAFPQFTRDIDVDGFGTLNIHYLHQRSSVDHAIPLLFVHGWPGHFMEAQKIIPLLTSASPDHPSFHVVAVSLPNFGFSEAPKKKGFSLEQYAEVGNKLMLSLGYNEFVVQGGDWGYSISRIMAHTYGSKTVKAWHTNYPRTNFPSFRSHPVLYLKALVKSCTQFERAVLKRNQWMMKYGKGYFEQQATRPQTLGYSLADSPVGLLAWIYEKLVEWTDNYLWDDDEVLAWVSIYWFSRAGPAASVRIYYERVHAITLDTLFSLWSPIPLGLSFFPKDIGIAPPMWARTIGNVLHESVHESGGHFSAHEKPEYLVGDLRHMFAKGGPAYGVVSGKSGYA
ncbi:alpha/beta-hydrolase [Obba rivulosa]|uniref:Alpha/beta-hydrolase n=1 Tax=Obba rivulosa TaxID=1052685 RepID=A0A8E2DFX3_9APHY|nr:alpha/beta-hydrolase [Obba rivulosa]